MMFHSLYLLIVLMSLAGNENNVALLGHHAGSAYSLATVDNGDNLLHLLWIESGEHVVDDVLRFLETWVVACDNHTVALLDSLLSHERTLALVAVATCSTHGDDMSFAVEHLVYGVEHILKSVGRVGVVDNSRAECSWSRAHPPVLRQASLQHHKQQASCSR